MNIVTGIKDETNWEGIAPDSLLSLRFVLDASLSPGGQWAAYVVSRTVGEEEHSEIFLRDTNSGEIVQVNHEEVKASGLIWSPDGNSLAFIANGGIRIYDPASRQTKIIIDDGWGATGTPEWSPDGNSLVVSRTRRRAPQAALHITHRTFRIEGMGYTDEFEHALVVIHLDDAREVTLADEAGPYVSPTYSPCGEKILYRAHPTHVRTYTPYLYTIETAGGEPSCIAGEGWWIEQAVWTPDGNRIVICGDYNSAVTVPTGKLWVINSDGTEPELRTSTLMGHVGLRAHHDMPLWALGGGRMCFEQGHVLTSIQMEGRCGIWKIALDGDERLEQIVGGDRTCILTSSQGRLLYITTDLMRPTELEMSDLDGENQRSLTDLNSSAMKNWPKMKFDHLKFSSIEGLQMEAWNVSRTDRSGPQPTVLYIHGGPFLGQGHYFRFDTHLLAANGISVLFANFRGSAGYGEAFSAAVCGDWGSRGFPDHMKTVDAAIEAGLADPEFLGVWGHSHGGFATCWIVGHTDRFAAAVAEASITNWETVYYLCDHPDGFVADLKGTPLEIPDVYRSRSPLVYANRCKTPTRMIQDEMDLRATLAEAEQFYRALRDNDCESDFVILRDCNHLGDAQGPVPARVAQNEALLGWFSRWLKPAPV